MAFLLSVICTESRCDHRGCTEHQERVQYQVCHAGCESAILEDETAHIGSRDGHHVEVPYMSTEDDLLAMGWRRNGRFWNCPECEVAA